MGSVAAFRRSGFDGTGAVCAPGSREPNGGVHSRDDGIPEIPVPLAVRGAYRGYGGEFMVQCRVLYNLVTTILYGYVSLALGEIIEAPQVIGYPVYEIMQIIAAILYLRSKGLGYILGVNILGLIVQLPSLPKLIENLLRLDIFFEYAEASTYLDWGLYIIDVALCIFFIVITIREYSRRQRMKTTQTQPVYAAAPHTSVPPTVMPHNPEAPAQAPTAQTQNPPEPPLM